MGILKPQGSLERARETREQQQEPDKAENSSSQAMVDPLECKELGMIHYVGF